MAPLNEILPGNTCTSDDIACLQRQAAEDNYGSPATIQALWTEDSFSDYCGRFMSSDMVRICSSLFGILDNADGISDGRIKMYDMNADVLAEVLANFTLSDAAREDQEGLASLKRNLNLTLNHQHSRQYLLSRGEDGNGLTGIDLETGQVVELFDHVLESLSAVYPDEVIRLVVRATLNDPKEVAHEQSTLGRRVELPGVLQEQKIAGIYKAVDETEYLGWASKLGNLHLFPQLNHAGFTVEESDQIVNNTMGVAALLIGIYYFASGGGGGLVFVPARSAIDPGAPNLPYAAARYPELQRVAPEGLREAYRRCLEGEDKRSKYPTIVLEASGESSGSGEGMQPVVVKSLLEAALSAPEAREKFISAADIKDVTPEALTIRLSELPIEKLLSHLKNYFGNESQVLGMAAGLKDDPEALREMFSWPGVDAQYARLATLVNVIDQYPWLRDRLITSDGRMGYINGDQYAAVKEGLELYESWKPKNGTCPVSEDKIIPEPAEVTPEKAKEPMTADQFGDLVINDYGNFEKFLPSWSRELMYKLLQRYIELRVEEYEEGRSPIDKTNAVNKTFQSFLQDPTVPSGDRTDVQTYQVALAGQLELLIDYMTRNMAQRRKTDGALPLEAEVYFPEHMPMGDLIRETVTKEELAAIVNANLSNGQKTIMLIGPSAKEISAALKESKKDRVIVVEMDSNVIMENKRKFNSEPRIRWVQGIVGELVLSSGIRADYIKSSFAVTIGGIQNISDWVKPGGIIVIQDASFGASAIGDITRGYEVLADNYGQPLVDVPTAVLYPTGVRTLVLKRL